MPGLLFIDTNHVAASALIGREQEVANYYRSVVAVFACHGLAAQLERRSPYFWLKPAIISNGSVLTQCLWYDTVPEAKALLRVLVNGPEMPDGELWDDLDQGWHSQIWPRLLAQCLGGGSQRVLGSGIHAHRRQDFQTIRRRELTTWPLS